MAVNGNGVIKRKLNNAFIGLPDPGTEYCISRAPERRSLFFGCLATVLVKDYFGDGVLLQVLYS